MSIVQIWEVAGPLIIIAFAILIAGLLLNAIQRKIKSGIVKNMIKVIVIITVGAPLLFLLYTLIRGIIFILVL
jgi:hypothetical protein